MDSRTGMIPASELGLIINKMCSVKEGNVLFHDALNTIYLRLYGVGC